MCLGSRHGTHTRTVTTRVTWVKFHKTILSTGMFSEDCNITLSLSSAIEFRGFAEFTEDSFEHRVLESRVLQSVLDLIQLRAYDAPFSE